MKKIYTEEGITKGDLFFAFETRCYDNGDIIFYRGKIYRSNNAGHITDEKGDMLHAFTYGYWSKCLIKIGNIDSTTTDISYDNFVAQKLNMIRLLSKYGYAYNFKTKEIFKKKNKSWESLF